MSVNPQTRRVLSGMRPTGPLHLGNYHGALRNWVELQYQYECFFFVADWHALTTGYEDVSHLQEHVEAVLGAAQRTTPAADVPPGRGYARLGTGPVLRLQVPATPDPFDEEAPRFQREAVLALVPGAPLPPAPEPAPPTLRKTPLIPTVADLT